MAKPYLYLVININLYFYSEESLSVCDREYFIINKLLILINIFLKQNKIKNKIIK